VLIVTKVTDFSGGSFATSKIDNINKTAAVSRLVVSELLGRREEQNREFPERSNSGD